MDIESELSKTQNKSTMKTLILYMSKHGCTEKAANTLKENLISHEVSILNLRKEKAPSLNDFEVIIIGSSIHAGQNQKKIKKFCEQNMDILLTKKLGLYLSCMEKGDKAAEQLTNAYPEALTKHAISVEIFGGEFNFDQMNFIEKAIIKKIAKTDKNVSTLDEEKIKNFAKKFA